MKSLAWIVTALLVIGAGALWLRSLPDAQDEAVATTPGPEESLDPDPVPTDQRRVAAAQPTPTRPTLAPHEQLVNDLWSVLGTGDAADQDEEQRLLRELVADGSDPALAAAIEVLEDPRCVHFGQGNRVLTLLAATEGRAQVYRLARNQVENLTTHQGAEYSIAGLNPWFQLAARHDPERGTSFVLAHLRSADPVLQRAAADVAVTLASPRQRELVLAAFLGDLGLDPAVVQALALGLARQEDDQLREALFELALDDLGEPVRRGFLLEYLGPFLDEVRLGQYVLLDRQLEATDLGSPLQLAVTAGLCRAKANERLSDATLDLVLGSFALESIADEDPVIAAQGADLVRRVDGLHDLGGAASVLQARYEGGTSAALGARLKAALAVLEQ